MVNKLLAIVATSLPGLQKLCAVAIAIAAWGSNIAGIYSQELAVMYFLCLLTSLGYGANILKIAPNLDEEDSRQLMRGSTSAAILFSLFIFILYLMVGAIYPPLDIHFKLPLLMLLVSSSIYQIIRHLYLANKEYLKLIYVDMLFIAVLCAPIFFFNIEQYFYFSSFMLVFLMTFITFRLSGKLTFDKKVFLSKTSLQYSINTVISGGVIVVLPKIVSLGWNNTIVVKVAFYISSLSLFMIFIRSFINFKIPDLAKSVNKGRLHAKKAIDDTRKRAFLLILGTFAIAACFFEMTKLVKIDFDFVNVLIQDRKMYYTVLFFVLSASLAVVDGVALFLIDKQKHNIESNTLYFMFFIILSAFSITQQEFNIYIYFLLLSGASVFRFVYLRIFTNKYYH